MSLDPAAVRANLERVAASGWAPDVEICAAIKYVDAGELPALAEAGITLVGENRAQDLAGEAGGARRAVRVGLHRRPAEPQGEGRRARACA